MIRRLDASVAAMIAAGEVIERPSSVAKELLENAIDAYARNISLHIEQGGKVSFVIEDDGAGIPYEDLPLAIERYATSKISSLDDLDRVSTLGYRGEALASIAEVSRLEIRSRTKESDSGGVIRCEGGVTMLHIATPCMPGTRVQVDDLFYNLPARRKFLKSATAELRRILQIVNDYALIHPEIAFRVFSDGKKILEREVSESIEETLISRWGKDAEIYFSGAESGPCAIRIWWNPVPDSKRVVMTVFVNGRRIQDPTIRAAICGGDSAAYGEWLIKLDLPLDQVDVNVHPTKEEIRFRRSGEIFRLVYENAQNVFAKRFAVRGTNGHPAAFFETRHNAAQPAQQGLASDGTYRFAPHYGFERDRVASSAMTVFFPAEHDEMPEEVKSSGKNYLGQTSQGFLLFDFPHGLAIVDPHAAHERILFEEISSSFKDAVQTQLLAIPAEIPAALVAEAKLNEPALNKLGFSFEGALLTGVPQIRGKGHLSPIDMLRSAMRGIETEHDPAKRDMEVWWRLARLACRDAVKLVQRMEKEEAIELLKQLESCSTPYTCPHGRPTIFILEHKQLKDWFDR